MHSNGRQRVRPTGHPLFLSTIITSRIFNLSVRPTDRRVPDTHFVRSETAEARITRGGVVHSIMRANCKTCCNRPPTDCTRRERVRPATLAVRRFFPTIGIPHTRFGASSYVSSADAYNGRASERTDAALKLQRRRRRPRTWRACLPTYLYLPEKESPVDSGKDHYTASASRVGCHPKAGQAEAVRT